MLVHPGGFSVMNGYLNFLTLSSAPHRQDHSGVSRKCDELHGKSSHILKETQVEDWFWLQYTQGNLKILSIFSYGDVFEDEFSLV